MWFTTWFLTQAVSADSECWRLRLSFECAAQKQPHRYRPFMSLIHMISPGMLTIQRITGDIQYTSPPDTHGPVDWYS